jgi:hypothetical protein
MRESKCFERTREILDSLSGQIQEEVRALDERFGHSSGLNFLLDMLEATA